MKNYLKVLIVDAVLLVALYYVVMDIQWRVAYAAVPGHGHTPTGYATTFSYSILSRVFTMTGSGSSLSSPPTLDWVQVLGVALVVVNGWYLYSLYAKKKAVPMPAPDTRA